MRLLDDHVRRFNEAVRSGDFGPMVAAFADDDEPHFEGIPAGPFIGKHAGEMHLSPCGGESLSSS
jgi:hypothetical protein